MTKVQRIHCSQNMSYKGGLTRGLFCHLKSKHNFYSSESEDQPCSKKVKVQQKSILRFVSVKKVCKILSLNCSCGWFFYTFY